MLFSFELQSVTCNRILSSEDSPWGRADGIRLYFILATSGGFHQVLVSGSEFPQEPDDNYYFVPGKTLDLAAFPPLNEPGWTSGQVPLSDTDDVKLAVVGVNEGLASVGGGGGSWWGDDATLAGFEELATKAAEQGAKRAAGKGASEAVQAGAEAAGASAFAPVWELFKSALEHLNSAPDCRGVAFVYEMELSMKKLLHDHLGSRTSNHRLGSANAASALSVVTGAAKRSSDCGSPDYEVELRIERLDRLGIDVQDQAGAVRQGERAAIPVRREECRPSDGAELLVWPEFTDRTITFRPSHYYASLKPTWWIDGAEVQRHQGSVTLTKPGDPDVGDAVAERQVTIEYERVVHDGIENLVLRTRGDDSNYFIRVSLQMNFEGVHPLPSVWAQFADAELWVMGRALAGNEAYREYIECVAVTGALEAGQDHIVHGEEDGDFNPTRARVDLRERTRVVTIREFAQHLPDAIRFHNRG